MRRREFLRWLGFAGATVAAAPALAVMPRPDLAAMPAALRLAPLKTEPLSAAWRKAYAEEVHRAFMVHPRQLDALLAEQSYNALQTALGRKVDAAIFEDYEFQVLPVEDAVTG